MYFIHGHKFILVILIFCFTGQLILSQDRKTHNNYTGDWESPSSWNPAWTNPQININNLDITINGYITANSSLHFSGSSKLIVDDTLVINGDLLILNDNELEVNEGGVLVVRGNLIFSNKAEITADGYIIITGNVTKEGSVNEGSFDSGDDPARVFIGGTVSPGGLQNDKSDFEALNCLSPEYPYPNSGCSYGNIEDLANDQIYQFFLTTCPHTTAGSNSPLCPGSTLTLFSSGGSAYSWTGPQGFTSTAQSPTITAANTDMTGIYTVIITDGFGCTSEKQVNILVNPPPELVITNPAVECYPATIDLTQAAITAGSAPGLSWSWHTDPEGTVELATPQEAGAGTWYIKGTTADECYDVKPVSVTILPPVTGNTISGDPALCYMDSPELTGVSDLSGGNGEFRYKWETAGNELTWEPAAGSANNTGYIAPPIADPSYFRRIVFSGVNDICRDTSNIFKVDIHTLSYAEIIETTDTICAGSRAELRFNLMGEGPWELVYSDGTENFFQQVSNLQHASSIIATAKDSATYKYQIVSLTDRFGCIAPEDNISGIASLTVYAYPKPDPGYSAEVCGNTIQLNANPRYGHGRWQSEALSTEFYPARFSPDALATVTEYGRHRFTWTETNWQCSASADISVSFYEQPEEVFAGYDKILQFIFETNLEAVIPYSMPEAYGGWEVIKGNGQIVFKNDPRSRVIDLEFGENTFVWTLFNGVCEPVSVPVTILIKDLGFPNAFSPNNSGYNDRFVINGIENSKYNKFTVFNRQGNKVFNAVNYQNDWDGRNHNGVPLKEDTFFYILNVDNKYSYKGFIVLKR
jgi:gliding motility-associated-like protein